MIYLHYKGGLYTKVTEAFNSEQRDQLLVIYVSHSTGKLWARPKAMFEEDVMWPDGKRRPRFTTDINTLRRGG